MEKFANSFDTKYARVYGNIRKSADRKSLHNNYGSLHTKLILKYLFITDYKLKLLTAPLTSYLFAGTCKWDMWSYTVIVYIKCVLDIISEPIRCFCPVCCVHTCLCLRKSSAIWTFCSRWNLIRPFSLGCNRRERRINADDSQLINSNSAVFSDTNTRGSSERKVQWSKKVKLLFWHEMVLWGAPSSTGAVKDMSKLDPNHAGFKWKI